MLQVIVNNILIPLVCAFISNVDEERGKVVSFVNDIELVGVC